MGFLKKFFRNVFRDGSMPVGTSSFEHLTEEDLEAHLGVCRYGDFTLTDAIRPSYDLQVVPCQGFRHDAYRDDETQSTVPVLMGAVTRERRQVVAAGAGASRRTGAEVDDAAVVSADGALGAAAFLTGCGADDACRHAGPARVVGVADVAVPRALAGGGAIFEAVGLVALEPPAARP